MKKGKVIVVDDEVTVLDVIKRVLKRKGWDVQGAEGAFEAFSLLAEEEPDTWIIDVKLPGLDGVELAKKIRAVDPDARIFLMTGYPDKDLPAKINSLEPIKVIEKPVDPTIFHDLMSQGMRC